MITIYILNLILSASELFFPVRRLIMIKNNVSSVLDNWLIHLSKMENIQRYKYITFAVSILSVVSLIELSFYSSILGANLSDNRIHWLNIFLGMAILSPFSSLELKQKAIEIFKVFRSVALKLVVFPLSIFGVLFILFSDLSIGEVLITIFKSVSPLALAATALILVVVVSFSYTSMIFYSINNAIKFHLENQNSNTGFKTLNLLLAIHAVPMTFIILV